jgi:hypothetical protein
MTYHFKIRQRALALIQEGYVAAKVADMLSKELKDELNSPCEKTIDRWKIEAKRQQGQAAETTETMGKTPRERLITNDALYEKIIDFPPWAKNPPK